MIRAARLELARHWWVAALVLVCLADGALIGVKPSYGLLGAVGAMFAAVVIADLTLGYAFFTALMFLDLLSSGGSFSATKVIGLILFASWVARVTAARRTELRSFAAENPWLVAALVAMLGWAALSFAWAQSPGAALGGTGRIALDATLLPIGFAAVRERRQLRLVLGAFVVGAVFSALYGFAHPTAQGSSYGGRLTGTVGDPNAEATVTAVAIPLVMALLGTSRRSARAKLLALAAVAILLIGLVTTASREGLLGLAAVLVAAVVFGGRWRRQAAALLVVGLAATSCYLFVLAPLATRQRITMTSTSGRSTLWAVAWRITKAHPLLGVGQDNFILVARRYVNRPGALQAGYVITTPKAAHNTYLEALADLGVPGLITYLAVLVAALAAAIRAVRIFERLGDTQMELLARSLVYAQAGVLVAHFFVSGEIEKYQWLLLALCPAALALARRARARSVRPARPVAAGALSAATATG